MSITRPLWVFVLHIQNVYMWNKCIYIYIYICIYIHVHIKYRPLTRYAKSRTVPAPGMPGTFFHNNECHRENLLHVYAFAIKGHDISTIWTTIKILIIHWNQWICSFHMVHLEMLRDKFMLFDCTEGSNALLSLSKDWSVHNTMQAIILIFSLQFTPIENAYQQLIQSVLNLLYLFKHTVQILLNIFPCSNVSFELPLTKM